MNAMGQPDQAHLRRIEGLFNIFVLSVECEISIENMRLALSQNDSFIPEHLFFHLMKMYSSNTQEEERQIEYCTLNFETIKNLISQKGLQTTLPELIKIFTFHSDEFQRGLTFANFSKYILPKRNYQLRQQVLYRNLQIDNYFKGQTHKVESMPQFRDVVDLVAYIFFFEVRYFREIQELRRVFFNPNSFNPFHFYERIDWKNQGWIGYENIVSLFLDIKKSVFSEEYRLFLDRIKVGFEKEDNTLTFKDFINIVFLENLNIFEQVSQQRKANFLNYKEHPLEFELDKFPRNTTSVSTYGKIYEKPIEIVFPAESSKSMSKVSFELGSNTDMKSRVQALLDSVDLRNSYKKGEEITFKGEEITFKNSDIFTQPFSLREDTKDFSVPFDSSAKKPASTFSSSTKKPVTFDSSAKSPVSYDSSAIKPVEFSPPNSFYEAKVPRLPIEVLDKHFTPGNELHNYTYNPPKGDETPKRESFFEKAEMRNQELIRTRKKIFDPLKSPENMGKIDQSLYESVSQEDRGCVQIFDVNKNLEISLIEDLVKTRKKGSDISNKSEKEPPSSSRKNVVRSSNNSSRIFEEKPKNSIPRKIFPDNNTRDLIVPTPNIHAE